MILAKQVPQSAASMPWPSRYLVPPFLRIEDVADRSLILSLLVAHRHEHDVLLS